MSLLQIVILALVQGITEFLPISSSAHLNLVHLLTPFPDQGPLVDVAIHLGSLVAVMIYFWRDMIMLLQGALDLVRGRYSAKARLLTWLVLASVPVFIVGFVLLKSGAVDAMRTIAIIAVANLIFAALLYHADRYPDRKSMAEITFGEAILIGASQILSLIPGVSRSGITMTAARYLGFDRAQAARFSMLLAIPTILGAGAGASLEIYVSGNIALQHEALVAGALSFVAALASIWAMMKWLQTMSFTPFVIYRIVLGVALLAFLALG